MCPSQRSTSVRLAATGRALCHAVWGSRALAPRWSGARRQASDVQTSPAGSPIVAENDYSINPRLAPALGPAGLVGHDPPAAQRGQTVRGNGIACLLASSTFAAVRERTAGRARCRGCRQRARPGQWLTEPRWHWHAGGAASTQRSDDRPGRTPTDCLCNRFLVGYRGVITVTAAAAKCPLPGRDHPGGRRGLTVEGRLHA